MDKDKRDCPFCDSALVKFEKNTVQNTISFWCDECELEFVQYPQGNKKGVQRTGLHIFIPLARYSEEEWRDFLFTEKNVYGEMIPERMPIFSSPGEKEAVQKQREQKLQVRREWEKKVS